MNRRDAKIVALDVAWQVIEVMAQTGDFDVPPEAEHRKVTRELDVLAQSLFERMRRLKERT